MLLDVQNLTVHFGGLVALSNISISMELGKIIGLIGPNGAGKTTLLNLITNVNKKSEGKIIFNGLDLSNKRPDEISHLGISRTFQNIRLFPRMKVYENVAIGINSTPQYGIFSGALGLPNARKKNKESYDIALEYLDKMGILEYKDKNAGDLPYGIQRKLEIARAIATKPKLLLLDEPAAGMNNDEALELIQIIMKIFSENDISIILIEHHLEVVMKLCSDILVLNLGKLLARGTPDEIQSNPEVIKAYIGERRSIFDGPGRIIEGV